MTNLIWQDSFKIGVQEIDEQHQHLINVVNDFEKAISKGEGHQHMEKVLNELIDYAEYHFATEENLMKDVGYPELEEHSLEHLALKGRVSAFKEKLSEFNVSLYAELQLFLSDWLEHHINTVDKKFGSYMQNK